MQIKKVSFSLPLFMKEILKNDKEYFDMEIGGILNRLIKYYSSKKIEKVDLHFEKNYKIQFNLSIKNSEMYFKILNENSFDVESDYMRSLVFNYINNPRYVREEIIFDDVISVIKESQKRNKKLNIMYNDLVRTVNPYAIKFSKEESRLYLFCFCEKNNDYRNYKISKIKTIMISSYDIVVENKENINKIIKNFDAFISNDKIVKTKLSEKGKEILSKAILNRPKYEVKDDFYYFECDEKLAQIYFAQFYDDIEILEPLSLRNWFKEKYSNLKKIYI